MVHHIPFDRGSRFTFLQESMINVQDCVELGLSCANVCKFLDRGLKGRRLDELSQPMLDAIEQLTRYAKTPFLPRAICSLIARPQNCGRDSEDCQAGWAKYDFSNLPRKG